MMETDEKNKTLVKHTGHSMKHMWIMAACCAIPIVGFLVIGATGAAFSFFEPLFSLICVAGMGYMMFSMHKDHTREKDALCQGNRTKEEAENAETLLTKQPDGAAFQKTGKSS